MVALTVKTRGRPTVCITVEDRTGGQRRAGVSEQAAIGLELMMRYFMDDEGLVVVVPGNVRQPMSTFMIPDDVARAVELAPGEVLPGDAQDAVREGDWESFVGTLTSVEGQDESVAGANPDGDGLSGWTGVPAGDQLPLDALPPLGRWEYRVMALTELGGFATAKGTAGRMEVVANEMAGHGWELVVANDRAARYVRGESLLLTFRRFITTEADYMERYRAEERLRRIVAQSLDQ